MKRLDRTLQRMRMHKVKPFVDRASRVLDIGCFDGTLADQLGPFAAYTGVDPEAPLSSDKAGRQFIRGTFPDDAIPNESFDVITALAVLEHVPANQQVLFARRCFSALVPSGRLVITVPSPLVDPILDVLRALRVLDGMETEQHYGFKPSKTLRVFGDAGFILERHEKFELGLNELFVFRRPLAAASHAEASSKKLTSRVSKASSLA